MTGVPHQYDLFISHASEDKESFVRPLAMALVNLGVSVWFDEFSLRIGDSLSRSIDRGLAGSRYGLVVISRAFIAKPWPEYEIRGLVAREQDDADRRVILPIWHGVTRSDVLGFSPPLTDKIALNTTQLGAEAIALQLLPEIRPDFYESHPRSQLQRLASGKALRALRQEIDETRHELQEARKQLSEFQCPVCCSALASKGFVPREDDYYASAYLLERCELSATNVATRLKTDTCASRALISRTIQTQKTTSSRAGNRLTESGSPSRSRRPTWPISSTYGLERVRLAKRRRTTSEDACRADARVLNKPASLSPLPSSTESSAFAVSIRKRKKEL